MKILQLDSLQLDNKQTEQYNEFGKWRLGVLSGNLFISGNLNIISHHYQFENANLRDGKYEMCRSMLKLRY